MGVTAGVPPRVEAGTKAALLDLVDGAVGEGWSTARACSVLELDSRRCRRWQHRRGAGRLDDNTAGGTAVHAITPFERRAIVELFERWGDIDGGYRKLAHRGSYENLVWVSPSTLAAPEPAPAKPDNGDTYLRGHQDPPWTGHAVNTISRTRRDSINSPGDELWYELLSLDADRVYHFFPLTNSIGNTKFEIYDSNGNIVRQKGHEVAAQAGTWTDRLGRVINRSLRLYFIPETDGTYHLRVYSTQSKTGTITLRYQDVTFARSRGDSSGEDCNSNIFFVNCRIKSAGLAVSGKIHVDDGAGSTWNDGMEPISPTPDGDGEYQSGYSEVDAYKTYLRKGFTYEICAATAGDGPLSLYIDRNYVNGKSTTSSGGARLCLNFTPEWTGSFYFKVGSRNQTDTMTGDTTVPSIGTYTISYTSN